MIAPFHSPRRIITHVALVATSIVMVLPIVWAILTSFTPANRAFSGDILGSRPTLENYREALDTFPVVRLLANSAIVAAFVTAPQVVISLLAAFSFLQPSFRGRSLAFAAVIGTILVPAPVLIVPNYLIAAGLDWTDSYTGLVVPQLASCGLGIFLFTQHMRSFPRELLEAARLDGASGRTLLWRVVVPSLWPSISAVTIIFFIASWNEYLWPLLIAQDTDHQTVQLGLQRFQGEQGTAWGRLMAAAMMASTPVLIAYGVAQRRIIDAFLRSGIK